MIDATSGGALMDKKPPAARHLISNMASNTQQFGIRGVSQLRLVNEIGAVDNLRLENQLTELTSLVRQLAVGQHQSSLATRVCGICTSMEHPTDMCPTLQETKSDHLESIGAIGGYQYEKQSYQNQQFDNQSRKQPFRPRPSQRPYVVQQFGSVPNVPQAQSGYRSSSPQYQVPPFQQHFSKIGQLETTVSHLQSVGSGNLPSQTIPNLRGNASAVTLRSGRELPQVTSQQESRPTDTNSELDTSPQTPTARKLEIDEKLLRIFRKVEINIPLLDAIKQILKYAKFLKELCVHKRKKIKGGVELGGIVSALTRNEDFTTGARQALPKK
ncbi:hypothetical protein CR513_10697, partial [Mucuna pruriens]